jgi:hypothetical protein
MSRLAFVSYSGAYPCLCFGQLVLRVDGVEVAFPSSCMVSGGSVSFDADWQEEVTDGLWEISAWPDKFPEELKADAVRLVNDNVPCGCCGGCV